MSDDSSGSEDEEQYPPWLETIVNEDYFNQVKVIQEEEDDAQPGYVRCKEIIVPDTADAAAGKASSDIRWCNLKKFTTVLIVSTPTDPPYIGLIDKIWREAKAKPLEGTTNMFATSDFQLECYWFYRPGEWPPNCWQFAKQPRGRGARFTLPGDKQPADEQPSQRHLLFSSHHTRHDYPDNHGLLSLEGFLQTCKMHWLGLKAQPPERFAIHRGSLVRSREPGFIVSGFLWCNAKSQPQLHTDDKRAFDLDGEWPDKATMKIVKHMMHHYQKEAKRLRERNQFVQDKFDRLAAQKEEGKIKDIPSDAGEDFAQQQQQQQPNQNPSSPLLPGV